MSTVRSWAITQRKAARSRSLSCSKAVKILSRSSGGGVTTLPSGYSVFDPRSTGFAAADEVDRRVLIRVCPEANRRLGNPAPAIPLSGYFPARPDHPVWQSGILPCPEACEATRRSPLLAGF